MPSLFFCYAPVDKIFYHELEKHLSILKQQGLLQSWSDKNILAGDVVQTQIEQALAEADIALLLVSSDFLATEALYDKQLTSLLVRQKSGSVQIIPVLIRPVEGWQYSKFGHLEVVPRGELPVSLWPDRDEAYALIAKEVRLVIEKQYAEMPSSQLSSSITMTLLPFLSTILKKEQHPNTYPGTNDNLYLRAEKLWPVLRTLVNSNFELAGASFLLAARPDSKEARDHFQRLLGSLLQQHPAVAAQMRSLLASQQVTQRVFADTGSQIEDVEQNTYEPQGSTNQSVEAKNQSRITGVKQNVNYRKP